MWLVFALATTLIWGLAEFFYKRGARPEEKYAHLKICVCVGAVMGLHAVFTLIFGNIGYDPANLLRYLPVSMLYILSMLCSFFGMRFIEESISDPIENTSGAVCALLCLLPPLSKHLPPLSLIAVLVIAVGVLGVGFLENSAETARKKKISRPMAILAFCMPFFYAIMDALGTYLDIFYLDDASVSPLINVTEENIEEVANVSYELTFALFALCLFVFLLCKKVRFELPKQGDKLAAAVCETGGQFTYVYAMSGNGAVAAPILSSVCVVSLLLSRIFLKEKLTKKQYAFIALVIAGILMLAISEE